ncbi:hypothetical protein AMECASPLE_023933 [Ameca splendens]|uniref:Uncharacterized protein n=1 Tax=Ameca splendens TaxID=208324 RepID=A0ABV0XHB6_9TELE
MPRSDYPSKLALKADHRMLKEVPKIRNHFCESSTLNRPKFCSTECALFSCRQAVVVTLDKRSLCRMRIMKHIVYSERTEQICHSSCQSRL